MACASSMPFAASRTSAFTHGHHERMVSTC
jgi:hypothetical protein